MNRRLKIGCHFGLGQICPGSFFRLITLLAYLLPQISSVYLTDSPLPLTSGPRRLCPVHFRPLGSVPPQGSISSVNPRQPKFGLFSATGGSMKFPQTILGSLFLPLKSLKAAALCLALAAAILAVSPVGAVTYDPPVKLSTTPVNFWGTGGVQINNKGWG
jgi:hypothetical protein